jgi:hypothetical protein
MQEETTSNLKTASTKMWVIAVALGLLIVFSGVQAMELASLKNKMDTELSDLTALASTKTTKTSTAPSSSLQKNLQNLPSMVGGC